eukprot:30294-Pelagococcus_subviridis.AAC.101
MDGWMTPRDAARPHATGDDVNGARGRFVHDHTMRFTSCVRRSSARRTHASANPRAHEAAKLFNKSIRNARTCRCLSRRFRLTASLSTCGRPREVDGRLPSAPTRARKESDTRTLARARETTRAVTHLRARLVHSRTTSRWTRARSTTIYDLIPLRRRARVRHRRRLRRVPRDVPRRPALVRHRLRKRGEKRGELRLDEVARRADVPRGDVPHRAPRLLYPSVDLALVLREERGHERLVDVDRPLRPRVPQVRHERDLRLAVHREPKHEPVADLDEHGVHREDEPVHAPAPERLGLSPVLLQGLRAK